MKTAPSKSVILIVAVALAAFLSGCTVDFEFGFDEVIEGSDEEISWELDAADITDIDVSNTFEVVLRPGASESVRIEADENFEQYVIVEVDGDRLELSVDSNISLRGGQLRAVVGVSELDSLRLDGASRVLVDGALDGSLDLIVDGASTVDLGSSRFEDLDADLNGASSLMMRGGAIDDAEIDASGASTVRLDGTRADRVEVDVYGASTVDVRGAEEVRGQADGASTVRVGASAITDVETHGASSLVRG